MYFELLHSFQPCFAFSYFVLYFQLTMHRTRGALGSARLPLLDLPSQRGTASPKCLFGGFCIMWTHDSTVSSSLWCTFNNPVISLLKVEVTVRLGFNVSPCWLPASGAGFCQTLSRWGEWGQHLRAGLCPQKLSEAVGKFYMVLMFLQFWMWCFKIDFEYVNTPTVYLYPALTFSPPPSSQKDCVGHDIEMPVMRCVGISSLATALRSPNSGVKLPLLAPYFLWKQRLPHPSTCCPHCTAPSGSLSLLCVTCSG